jgi:hypothetical protein
METVLQVADPAVHHRSRLTGRLFTSPSAVHPAVNHSPLPTEGLLTAQQPCSPPAANSAGESPATHEIISAIEPQSTRQ